MITYTLFSWLKPEKVNKHIWENVASRIVCVLNIIRHVHEKVSSWVSIVVLFQGCRFPGFEIRSCRKSDYKVSRCTPVSYWNSNISFYNNSYAASITTISTATNIASTIAVYCFFYCYCNWCSTKIVLLLLLLLVLLTTSITTPSTATSTSDCYYCFYISNYRFFIRFNCDFYYYSPPLLLML